VLIAIRGDRLDFLRGSEEGGGADEAMLAREDAGRKEARKEESIEGR
jgi:hypothetical protein